MGQPLSHRERVIRTVRFQEVDRLPFRHAFGLMPGVLEDWHDQGLPRSVQTDQDICEAFGFPPREGRLPVSVSLDPPFETKVLEESDDFRIAIDALGRRTKLSKRAASIALPMEYPVRDWQTWREYKRRLQFSPERVGADLERAAAENVAAGRLNVLGRHGFYWLPRDLMGDEGLCVAYYEQPDLVRDILETYCRLLEQTLEAVLARIALDELHLGEDMAYRHASMVGKNIFDEFLRPYYLRVRAILQRHRVPIFSVDTDGHVGELAGWLVECGVNRIGPNEVQAGNDIREYRRRFGRRLAFDGGLDKLVLPRGRRAIDEMLEAVFPVLKATGGGWIVSLDHRVVRDTSLADFRHYVDRVRELSAFE